MTISVNEQVTGHKVTVRPAARTQSGQRRASCQCLAVSDRQHRAGHARDTNPPGRSRSSHSAASGTTDQAWLQDLPALTPASWMPCGPAALASKAGRLQRLRVAKAQLEAEAAERQRRYEQRVAELAAAARTRGKQPRARIRPRARDEAPKPEAVANVTDPDSRLVHTRKGSLQGYNAQAVTTMEQVIVAAELTQQANDLQQLQPMLAATAATLAAAGIAERPGTLLADCGYWTIANLTQIPDAPELLIPPARHGRQGKPRKDGKASESKSDGLRAAMTAKLQADDGKARYGKRKETVEPVFGQIKDVRGARRFMRRGLQACQAEWKLLCGTHNLLKLWRHRATPRLASPATT
jgi:hypothetical protein